MPPKRTLVAKGKTYLISAHAWERIRKIDIDLADVVRIIEASKTAEKLSIKLNILVAMSPVTFSVLAIVQKRKWQMKLTYDPAIDVLFIELNAGDEFTTDTKSVPGLAIIYDTSGKVCGIEIEDASKLIHEPNRVDFEYFAQEDTTPEFHSGD